MTANISLPKQGIHCAAAGSAFCQVEPACSGAWRCLTEATPGVGEPQAAWPGPASGEHLAQRTPMRGQERRCAGAQEAIGWWGAAGRRPREEKGTQPPQKADRESSGYYPGAHRCRRAGRQAAGAELTQTLSQGSAADTPRGRTARAGLEFTTDIRHFRHGGAVAQETRLRSAPQHTRGGVPGDSRAAWPLRTALPVPARCERAAWPRPRRMLKGSKKRTQTEAFP